MKNILINIEDYDDDFKKEFCNKDVITLAELIYAIDDLICENGRLQEKIDELEESIQNDYKPINKHEFYGVNEGDF